MEPHAVVCLVYVVFNHSFWLLRDIVIGPMLWATIHGLRCQEMLPCLPAPFIGS
jgi:hypothetical protein